MGLPRLSIKHPVSTLMIMLMAIVVGLVSLLSSPMELMPELSPPVAVVMTRLPGASPNEVATLVTKPLEGAVATTTGLTGLSSTSQENLSLMTIQFDWGTDMSEARADLQQALDQVRLPEGTLKPMVVKFDPNAMPMMELSVTNGEDLSALNGKLAEDVIPRLEQVDGVAAVFVYGAADKEFQVLLDSAKLNQYGLTQQQIASVIQASNLTYPAGRITLDDKSLNLRILGNTNAVEQLEALVIAQVPTSVLNAQDAEEASTVEPDNATAMPGAPDADSSEAPSAQRQMMLTPIRLADVAQVIDGYADATMLNRTDGKPSLWISIQKEGQANTVDVSRAVDDELEAIRRDHRELDLVKIMDQGDMISRSISNVGLSLVGGGLLAMLVLLLFLRNIRPTLIIGVAIPFSVIVTFVILFMNELTMNLMTLGGLALGVGMLVDNAIVVIENIYRHLNELGEDPHTAAERGANEVAGPITSATLTTLAVFLPVVFVGGLTGELFTELALTVTFSLIASLAVALTVIPMMASRLLKPQVTAKPQARTRKRHKATTILDGYASVLRWSLGNRAITLLVAVALMVGSLAILAPEIGTEFIPEMDEGTFTVSVKLPSGTSLESASAQIDELALSVKRAVPAEIVTTTVGRAEGLAGVSAALSGNSAGDGQIRVTLDENYDKPTADAIKDARKALNSIKGNAVLSYNTESTLNMGGARGNSIQVNVTGTNPETVKELVQQVQEEMASVQGLVNLENNLDTSRPELQVIIDQEKAMKNGLVPAQIAATVADAVKGKIVTRMETADTSADVRVQFRAEDRESVAKIEEIRLKSPLGQTIPLSEVAEVREAIGPVSITREDRKNSAQIVGRFEDRDLGSVTADLNALIDEIRVPAGYEVALGGTSRMMSDGFDGLKIALIMAVLLIYMIMAAQFESLLHPFAILFTMPLAIIGIVGGLYLTNSSLGITAMIGVIILAGIVVNNGIVLVDFINKLRRSGLEVTEAIVEAGRTRLRPILMTALTTILGLLPLALKLGEGSEVQAPMAVVVIGGLLTSTLLTLVVIPVVYHLLSLAPSAAVVEDLEDLDEFEPPIPTFVPGGASVVAPASAVIPATQTTPSPLVQASAPIETEAAVASTSSSAQSEEERPPETAALSNEEFTQMLNLMGKLFKNTSAQTPKST